jgi:beta-glucosidase
MARYPYQDPSLPIDDRVDDLIKRMTLNQKIRQLTCLQVMQPLAPERLKDGIGEVIFVMPGSDLKTFAEGLADFQKQIIAANEWGIPAIFHSEALTGAQINGCAIFPSSLSIGATYDPELLKTMSDYIRQQMVDIGLREALAPVLDLARDFRWGRTNEDYSSDPTLVAEMACAYIQGLQGSDLRYGVAATTKHFLGYSVSEGGINLCRIQTDFRDLRENYAKPFEAAIRTADLKCVMNCYSEFDGEMVCASKRILTDLLRDDLGFKGTVVSDYSSVERLVNPGKIAENNTEAAIRCLQAGLDVELPNDTTYGPELREAVKEGRLDEKYIDRSLRRILHLKFELGLFEHPFADFKPLDNTEPHKHSKKISEKSIILEKNNGLLPLKDKKLKIAVIGPAGNLLRTLHGSYSCPASIEMMVYIQHRIKAMMQGIDLNINKEQKDKFNKESQNPAAHIDLTALVKPTGQPNPADVQKEIEDTILQLVPGAKTIFQAIKDIYPNTSYLQGCYFETNEHDDIKGAVEAAKKADVVILSVGGKNGWGSDCTTGEGIDRSDITLPGRQQEMCEQVMAANKNTIIVHTDNKPLVGPVIYEKAAAILECFYPGPFGGIAVAEVISGTYNPGARLPVDVPQNVGQTPLYYYQHNGSRSDDPSFTGGYVNGGAHSQLPFGFGLSYTSFAYADGKLESSIRKDKVPVLKASVNVTNTGKAEGDEVVLLFGKDEIASLIRPQQVLIGFKRITLKPGETKTVVLSFRLDQLAFPDLEGKWVIEKGRFTFDFAKDANTPIYTFSYDLDKTQVIDHTKRGFFAKDE